MPSPQFSAMSESKSSPNASCVGHTSCCRHCQTCNPAPILGVKTLQTLLWYLFVGFAATTLNRYLGVVASPVSHMSEIMARDVNPSMDIFYKGEHYDNGTGYSFDLYTVNDSVDENFAFADYMAAYIDDEDGDPSSDLQKRDWYDCQNLRTGFQTLGCNTAHGLGKVITLTGTSAFGGYLSGLLKEAFSNGRDNDRPRSICLTRDKNNLCVSWASYTGSGLPGKDADTITRFSTECAQSDGSAEFKTVMDNGSILYICVSNRADGCGKSVC